MALCDEIQHCVAGRAADFIEEALLGWTDETSRHGYAIPRIRGWRTWKNLARAGLKNGDVEAVRPFRVLDDEEYIGEAGIPAMPSRACGEPRARPVLLPSRLARGVREPH